MGMIKVDMYGSFPVRTFSTCAEEGGHVSAIERAIKFLADQLGPAVMSDAKLTIDGIEPPRSPLGTNLVQP